MKITGNSWKFFNSLMLSVGKSTSSLPNVAKQGQEHWIVMTMKWFPGVNVAQKDQAVQPTNQDVVFGRGRRYDNHPGNVQFHHIIGTYMKQYATAGNRAEKNAVAASVANNVCATGRFLKYDERCGGWIVADPDSTWKKVRQALRYRGKDYTLQKKSVSKINKVSDVEHLEPVPPKNAQEGKRSNATQSLYSQNKGETLRRISLESFDSNPIYSSSSAGHSHGETKAEMELSQGTQMIVEKPETTSSIICGPAQDVYYNRDKVFGGIPNKRLRFEVDDNCQQLPCKTDFPLLDWNQHLPKDYPVNNLEPTPPAHWQHSSASNVTADFLDEVDFLDIDLSMWTATEETTSFGHSEVLLFVEDDLDLQVALNTTTSHCYASTAVPPDFADQFACDNLLTDEEILLAIGYDCAENALEFGESEII